uniref:Expressed protein n=1 Tax=Oryza sativa subsp. japonica TaxID=39947 RepID=Q2RAP5_ORYSJ|nr:expressed protein [Oryza sativa Japonica Group]
MAGAHGRSSTTASGVGRRRGGEASREADEAVAREAGGADRGVAVADNDDDDSDMFEEEDARSSSLAAASSNLLLESGRYHHHQLAAHPSMANPRIAITSPSPPPSCRRRTRREQWPQSRLRLRLGGQREAAERAEAADLQPLEDAALMEGMAARHLPHQLVALLLEGLQAHGAVLLLRLAGRRLLQGGDGLAARRDGAEATVAVSFRCHVNPRYVSPRGNMGQAHILYLSLPCSCFSSSRPLAAVVWSCCEDGGAARVAEVVTGKESGDDGGACCPARKRRTSPELHTRGGSPPYGAPPTLGRGQAQAHIRIRQPPPSRQASVPHPQAPLPPSNSTSPSSSSSTGELGYDRRGGPCPGSRRQSAQKGRLGMCLSLVAATSPLLYRHRSPTPQAQECHRRCSRALGGRRIERKREEEMREEEEVAPWLWTEMWSKFLFAEWTSTSMPRW